MDLTGLWDYTDLPPCPGEALYNPHTASHITLDSNLGPARHIIRSLVHVEFHLPFKIDGVIHQVHTGIGVVVDAKRGLVVVDRHSVPASIGDCQITFANSIIVPGRIGILSGWENWAVVEYDTGLVGETVVESAAISGEVLKQGDSGIELENPISHGGVITSLSGEIQAFHFAHTKHSSKGRNEFFMGMPVQGVMDVVRQVQEGRVGRLRDVKVRGLEVEMTYAQVAHGRFLGLRDEWVKRIEGSHLSRRNLLVVRRLTSGAVLWIILLVLIVGTYCAIGTEAGRLLREGDVILAVDGEPATKFTDVTRHTERESLQLTVLREGKELEMDVPTSVFETSGTERIVGWSGAIFQSRLKLAHKAMYQQLKQVPQGVLCSVVYDGSPSQLYALHPLTWVTEVNGHPTPTLDAFLSAVKDIPSETYVRLKTVNFHRFVRVITIRTNRHYFGTWEIHKEGEKGRGGEAGEGQMEVDGEEGRQEDGREEEGREEGVKVTVVGGWVFKSYG
ncbi:hypothetical protein HDV00_002740 [Rhizophlyctis rosea]|nr:hypothetical protein HDV00_002740 [Rhizophlyctis rosea]